MKASPSGWINDPSYGAALFTYLRMEHPRWVDQDLAIRFGFSLGKIRRIKSSRHVMPFPEQLLVESLLQPATVSMLRAKYQQPPRPSFWGAFMES